MLPMLQINQGHNPIHTNLVPGNWLIRKPGPKGKAFRPFDMQTDTLTLTALAVRQKAVDFSNQTKAVVSYRPETTLFKKIVDSAEHIGSMSQYGPELLVYIHDGRYPGLLATVFGGSRTTRTEYVQIAVGDYAPNLVWRFNITQRSFGGGGYGRVPKVWFAPRIAPTEFVWTGSLRPEQEENLRKFLHPPTTAIELSSKLQGHLDKVNEALEGLTAPDKRAVVKAATGLSTIDLLSDDE